MQISGNTLTTNLAKFEYAPGSYVTGDGSRIGLEFGSHELRDKFWGLLQGSAKIATSYERNTRYAPATTTYLPVNRQLYVNFLTPEDKILARQRRLVDDGEAGGFYNRKQEQRPNGLVIPQMHHDLRGVTRHPSTRLGLEVSQFRIARYSGDPKGDMRRRDTPTSSSPKRDIGSRRNQRGGN